MKSRLNIDIPKVRVGRISYMNVAPVYYGLNNGHKPAWMEMICAPPADLNTMLADGKLDISPVSSAAYARNQDQWLLLPDLSISCFGKVMSVLLVSRYPFAELDGKKVVLTRESATAAALSRWLFASGGIRPHIETGKVRQFGDLQADAAAALVIGDAALREKWREHFAHVWDLGELWRERTALPFVFALWAVRKAFAQERPDAVAAVLEAFHASRSAGLDNISAILPEASNRLGISPETCRDYYRHLLYDLSEARITGLQRFFDGLYETHIISRPVHPTFFYQSARRENAA